MAATVLETACSLHIVGSIDTVRLLKAQLCVPFSLKGQTDPHHFEPIHPFFGT